VRDCTSFGMPSYVRVGGRPKADRERLIQALREELTG
jgi:histidinol-phosphate/aromatic aminotransferase/cobyric acid decarboxylase-like protein